YVSTGNSLIFKCEIDGTMVPCDEFGAGTHILSNGPHTFTVTATDIDGNIGYDTFTWMVDAMGPSVSILSPQPSDTSDSGTFVFSVSEPADLLCAIDGGSFNPCASGDGYALFPPGPHELEVVGIDLYGNQGPTASVVWIVN
ncbi:MAG: hypothetical protein ABL958_21990, partial [Bdellovibrionia bacterium]